MGRACSFLQQYKEVKTNYRGLDQSFGLQHNKSTLKAGKDLLASQYYSIYDGTSYDVMSFHISVRSYSCTCEATSASCGVIHQMETCMLKIIHGPNEIK